MLLSHGREKKAASHTKRCQSRKRKEEEDLTFRKDTSFVGLSLSEMLSLIEVGCYSLCSESVKNYKGELLK